MGVFGIASTSLIVDDVERGVNFVADDLGQRLDVDVVSRADVADFAVRTVVIEELFVDAADVLDVGEIACLFARPIDDRRFAVETPRDEVRHCHVRTHARAIHGKVSKGDCGETVDFVVNAGVLFGGEFGDAVGRDWRLGVVLVVWEVFGLAVHRG